MRIAQRPAGLLLSLCLLVGLLVTQTVWAATGSSATNEIQKIRIGQTDEKVRIVIDTTAFPEFTEIRSDVPLQLLVDLPNTVNVGAESRTLLNDPFVDVIGIMGSGSGRVRITVALKMAGIYRVFPLKNPNRLVIDIVKKYEKKIQQDVMPGLKYTSWQRSGAGGPVWAHIVEIDPQAGFALKPVLSNDMVPNVEPLLAMAQRNKAAAAVNGSYFSSSGEIIGLLKLDGQIVSTPDMARCALGILPDGTLLIDQVTYQGTLTLPDGRTQLVNGVNRSRGPDELILYNSYYGSATSTNTYGSEYVVKNGKIAAITNGNTVIPTDGYVLSAHGVIAKSLAGFKVGDSINLIQTLGPVWDKTVGALGAGPMLVKNGSVYLTTKIEEFGTDVAGGRAPRTALGVTKDGVILLVVVDGRQQSSTGMTLLELALLLQELGAVQAVNLDGGGSSEMVINDKIINKPSDGRERGLGDALLVVSTKLAN